MLYQLTPAFRLLPFDLGLFNHKEHKGLHKDHKFSLCGFVYTLICVVVKLND